MLDCLQEPPPYLADNEFEGHEIIPSLFLGDYSSASKRDALKERKVTHIINCARIARKWFPEVATRLFSSASIFCRNANRTSWLCGCAPGISRTSRTTTWRSTTTRWKTY